MANSQDDDSDWETDEETLTVAELNGFTDDFSDLTADHIKIVGIETNTPMMQVDHYIFTGHYEDIAGTMLTMEMQSEQNEPAIMIPSISKPIESEQLKYVCHTAKKMVLTRAFLTERVDPSQQDPAEGQSTQEAKQPKSKEGVKPEGAQTQTAMELSAAGGVTETSTGGITETPAAAEPEKNDAVDQT